MTELSRSPTSYIYFARRLGRQHHEVPLRICIATCSTTCNNNSYGVPLSTFLRKAGWP